MILQTMTQIHIVILLSLLMMVTRYLEIGEDVFYLNPKTNIYEYVSKKKIKVTYGKIKIQGFRFRDKR
jgi:hypothetical protein